MHAHWYHITTTRAEGTLAEESFGIGKKCMQWLPLAIKTLSRWLRIDVHPAPLRVPPPLGRMQYLYIVDPAWQPTTDEKSQTSLQHIYKLGSQRHQIRFLGKKKLDGLYISTESVSFEPTVHVIDSIKAKTFSTPISSVFVCVICQGVSSEKPLITQCEHVLCKQCIENWLKVSPVCPVCRFCLGDDTEGTFST